LADATIYKCTARYAGIAGRAAGIGENGVWQREAAMANLVEYKVADGVAEIVMNRAPVNAINLQLAREVSTFTGGLCGRR
jgi:hypothetical protein